MRLAEAVKRAFAGLEPPPEDFGEAFDRYSIRQLAEWFSGSSRGTEYRTARRRFERYRAAERGTGRQARRPDPDVLEFLRDLIEERRQEQLGQPVSLRIEAVVKVSTDTRRRAIHASLSSECVEEITARLAAGEDEGAADAFEECFGEENLGGQVPEFLDVFALDWV